METLNEDKLPLGQSIVKLLVDIFIVLGIAFFALGVFAILV